MIWRWRASAPTPPMTSPESLLNHTELRRYLGRIGDRWPLERAVLGGARVADARGRDASARARPRVDHDPGLGGLRRRAVARARLPGRQPVGRRGRWARRPTCTATRRRSWSGGSTRMRACARRWTTASSCRSRRALRRAPTPPQDPRGRSPTTRLTATHPLRSEHTHDPGLQPGVVLVRRPPTRRRRCGSGRRRDRGRSPWPRRARCRRAAGGRRCRRPRRATPTSRRSP